MLRLYAKKGAFLNQWKRKNTIPALNKPGRRSHSQNAVEKIVQRYAVNADPKTIVRQNDFVYIRPQHVMTHDNTSPVIKKFYEIGAKNVYDREQVVFTIDHDIQNKSKNNLKKYRDIEEFSKKQGIKFYPPGRGIGHQILVEEGYAYPGTLVVASDSHSNMYGGVGCLGTPVVRTDAAVIWATGQTWWQIPPVAKVEFINNLQPDVTGKDLIISLCGELKNDEVLNHAVEFHGKEGISNLSIDERLTIANMTTEWGALAGLFPVDEVLIEWLRKNANLNLPNSLHTHERIDDLLKNIIEPDEDCIYAKHIVVDLSKVTQSVSGPNTVKIKTPVSELQKNKIKINKAYIVSCVNSRASDLKAAAEVLKDKKIHKDVEMYVAPASSKVEEIARESGDWDIIINSGAKVLPAGCGPCIGLGQGLLEDNEVGISATNRNYKGRMGSPKALAYLASPKVVASSAINGYITSPSCSDSSGHSSNTTFVVKVMNLNKNKLEKETPAHKAVDGFNPNIEGDLIFCNADNLNTDGIYPGKYTYQDDIGYEKMAEIVMENYDPYFARSVRKDDILISGFNFGTGSSREQAALALLSAGINFVICGSFSDIYKRNAINNGLIVVEIPELVEKLRKSLDSGTINAGVNSLTIRTGIHVCLSLIDGHIDVFMPESSTALAYEFAPIGVTAQEIIVARGIESWARNRILNN